MRTSVPLFAALAVCLALTWCDDGAAEDGDGSAAWYIQVKAGSFSGITITGFKVESGAAGTCKTVEETGLSITGNSASDAYECTGTASDGVLKFITTVSWTKGDARYSRSISSTVMDSSVNYNGKTRLITVTANNNLEPEWK